MPTIPKTLLLVAALIAAGAHAQTSFNVRDSGATGDGHTKDTAALQRAIDKAGQVSGTVLLPPGTYVTGTLQLRSGITLHLQSGATLQGSPDVADYGSIRQFGLDHRYGVNSSGEGERVGVLVARNVHDITLEGAGAISGNGAAFFDKGRPHVTRDFDEKFARNPQALLTDMRTSPDGPWEVTASGRPGTMILFDHAENIHVHDIALRDSPNWTLHLQHAHDVFVHALRIQNDMHLPNNDGLDCMDCQDVHISDSDFTTGDDDFAFVGSDRITVSNCTLRSASAAVRVEDTRDAVMSHLIIDANRGIGIFAHEGGHSKNLQFSDIVLHTRLFHGHWWGKGEPIFLASSAPAGHGGIDHLVFSDMSVDAEAGILLDARNPGVVHDLTLRNITLRMLPPPADLATSQGGNFDLRWTARSLSEAIYRHDIPAIYSHNIATLNLSGIQITWAPNTPQATSPETSPGTPAATPPATPAYFSSALAVEDFNAVNINGFEAAAAPASTAAVINLQRGNTFDLRNATATPATKLYVQATALTQPPFQSNNNLGNAQVIWHH